MNETNKRDLKMTNHNIRCRENYRKYYQENPEVKQKKILAYYIKKLNLSEDFFLDCSNIQAKVKKAMNYNYEEKIKLLNL